MDIVRLGLIGCGGMMSNHAKGINLVDGIEITAVCDLISERAEKVAAVLNQPYVTTDYHTMLDHVDAVLVALPHDLHYECGMFFAMHKKHVMMEKPLCNTEEECLRLIETCDENGVVLMCAYPVRHWPGIVKLKEMVDSGEYGKIIQMSIWTEQFTKEDPLHWSNTARIGGGQFFSHGCHYVDLMMWFLGNPVRGSHFGTRVCTPWLLKEGTSVAIFSFESGALGYHGATWGAKGTKLGYSFQIQCEHAMLEYQHQEGVVRVYDGLAKHVPGQNDTLNSREVWKREGNSSKETQYEIMHFIDCIHTGKTPVTDGRTALQGLRVIWRMYDAEKTNTVADLRGLGFDEIER